MARDYCINEAIKQFVEKNHLKASEVADRAGINRPAFYSMLKNKRVIYADELIPIVNAAGIPLEQILAAVNEKGA